MSRRAAWPQIAPGYPLLPLWTAAEADDWAVAMTHSGAFAQPGGGRAPQQPVDTVRRSAQRPARPRTAAGIPVEGATR